MSINKILKISIVILFAFVFTDIGLRSYCNPPVITSPNDNDIFIAGKTYTDAYQATGDAVINWSGPGTFDPTAGSPVSWTAPGATGFPTITATNYYGSDQVQIQTTNIIYVDEEVVGGLDDGTSWANAFDTLQEGLNAANSGNHIWVAEGTYKPGAAKLDTFHLVPGVETYGGFDPTIGDDLWAERDYINNVTILSGDIDGDGLDNDNTYFVVTANDVTIDGSTRLDGFTITNGWSYWNLCDGAGMKIENCDPNVANCIFKENRAPGSDGDGGGMGCYNASPEVTNCIFIDNVAGDDGGALVNTYGSNGTFTNCVFYNNNTNGENVEDNHGKSNGGAIWNTASEKDDPIGSSPTFINCLIAGNSTVPGDYNGGKNGGGVANKGSGTNPVFINCTFTENTANHDGGGMCTKDYAVATVINCIFWDNKALDDDDSIRDKDDGVTNVSYSDVNQPGYAGNNNNISQDPDFVDSSDPDGGDNTFRTHDDGLRLDSDSPCIDAGNNSAISESKDIAGNDRKIDGDDDATATVDMGAYECVPIAVTHIKFDHTTGSDSADGIDIRENDSTDITVPEWVKGGQNKPAAYKKSTSVTIKAKFYIRPTTITSAKIKATTTDSIFGNLGEQTVTFSNGVSDYISFTPTNSTPSAIDKGTVTWQWKIRDIQGSGSPEYTFSSSGPHTIYTVLATPQAPQAEPWTEALDIACTKADGQTTAAAATRDIWDDFLNDAGGTYDTVRGASQYTGATTTSFNLTSWLANYPNIGTVNCYDMGKSVVVFANTLGCDTEYVFVYPFGYLNCIKPIGCGWTNNPFNPSNPIVDGDSYRSGFGNHGFSRLSGYIYDGSVGRVDIDNDPDYGPPFTEYELDGGETWTNDYDDIVIDYVPTSNPGTPTVYSFNVY